MKLFIFCCMKNVIILSLFVFILGMAFLFKEYSEGKPVSADKLARYENSFAIVEGEVVDVGKTRSGKTKLFVCDDTGCFYIVVKEQIYCKKIKVRGKVSEFRGKYYVHVYRISDVLRCSMR